MGSLFFFQKPQQLPWHPPALQLRHTACACSRSGAPACTSASRRVTRSICFRSELLRCRKSAGACGFAFARRSALAFCFATAFFHARMFVTGRPLLSTAPPPAPAPAPPLAACSPHFPSAPPAPPPAPPPPPRDPARRPCHAAAPRAADDAPEAVVVEVLALGHVAEEDVGERQVVVQVRAHTFAGAPLRAEKHTRSFGDTGRRSDDSARASLPPEVADRISGVTGVTPFPFSLLSIRWFRPQIFVTQ